MLVNKSLKELHENIKISRKSDKKWLENKWFMWNI